MRRLTFVLPLFRPRLSPRKRVPSGLLSLAAEARAHGGVAVEVVDAESAGWKAKDVVDYLLTKRQDIIGVSICSPALRSSVELIRVIREQLADAMIIVGGKHITHCWQDILQNEVEIDALVRGDGESVVSTLARSLSNCADSTQALSAIAGLSNVWVPKKLSKPTLPTPANLNTAPPWPFDSLIHDIECYKGDSSTTQVVDRKLMIPLSCVDARGKLYNSSPEST